MNDVKELSFKLVGRPNRIVVWPDDPAQWRGELKLPDLSQSWLDVKAGDVILMRDEHTSIWKQHTVESVWIFRCQPISWSGLGAVESGRAWLEEKLSVK